MYMYITVCRTFSYSFACIHVGSLRPSRELLEFYRQKIAEYDEEHEKFVLKLEKYKCSSESLVNTACHIHFTYLDTKSYVT